MKVMIKNTGYFLSEAWSIFRINRVSNIFSLLSMTLIFFVLAIVIGGWSISGQVVDAIKDEAEINVYMGEAMDKTLLKVTMESIEAIEGVGSVVYIDAGDAYKRMEKVLGEEAELLTLFDQNPFEGFLEVGIDLAKLDPVLTAIGKLPAIESVRDNKEVLDSLNQLSKVLNLMSYLVLIAVGITTLVTMSHMIRQGVYHHREQINTLELLGAPSHFIAIPFYIEGVMMAVVSGLLALGLTSLVMGQVYQQVVGPLPFIPLPSQRSILASLTIMMMILSMTLGIVGSGLGMKASKGKR